MGHPYGPASVGVVRLENKNLLGRHVAVVVPAVSRVVEVARRVMGDLAGVLFDRDGGDGDFVVWRNRSCVADGEWKVLWWCETARHMLYIA